ncbi:hypothetical protein DVA86_25770 [Streptomyces armeniacus]|uniref:Uncharacterized protein n=1 Tax=Streptomyces armeniacus TaxID=83291 RepID=A0A345Y175_9ACTN|nr:hypothetical protein DVA86_25770 [Streptomyces armeniacus]
MPRPPRGIALYSTVVCLLAVVAAVVSFAKGSWLGIVWVLLAGLTSNMAWYYVRRGRAEAAAARTDADRTDAGARG